MPKYVLPRCDYRDSKRPLTAAEERHRLVRFFASRRRRSCATPTDATPGSEEKIRLMTERAASGMPIFHPDDSEEMGDEPADDFDFEIGGEG